MRKYYCPLSNEQFNQLINFGKIFVPQCLLVEHSDDSDLVQSNLVNTFIKYLQFKYDEEYLVLEVNSVFNKVENEFQIKIHEVECIYPISEECSKAITFKHSKIAFSNPIFSSDSLSKINDAFFISDSVNGAECLISIFKNIFEFGKVKNDNIIQSAFKFRKRHKLNSLKPDCSIVDFTFLYVYQSYYPLTTLGYFYRTAEILTRKALLSKNIPYNHEFLEKTDIYKLLEDIKASKPESNLQEIITFLLTDSRATKFIENLSSEDVKYFIVIPMFLKIIDEFNDHNQNLEKTSLEKLIKYYKSSYSTECQQLVVWLGAYLGYGNCYDYFYSKSNLKFFKSYKPILTIADDKNISKIKHEIINEESVTKADNDNSKIVAGVIIDKATVVIEQIVETVKKEEMKLEVFEYETDKKNSETSAGAIRDNTTIDNEQTVEVTKKEENKLEMVEVSESKIDEENSESDEDQQILLALLNKKGACSLTVLTKELNTKQNKVFDKHEVYNILSKINGVELFTDKKTEKARIKPPALFDNIN